MSDENVTGFSDMPAAARFEARMKGARLVISQGEETLFSYSEEVVLMPLSRDGKDDIFQMLMQGVMTLCGVSNPR